MTSDVSSEAVSVRKLRHFFGENKGGVLTDPDQQNLAPAGIARNRRSMRQKSGKKTSWVLTNGNRAQPKTNV